MPKVTVYVRAAEWRRLERDVLWVDPAGWVREQVAKGLEELGGYGSSPPSKEEMKPVSPVRVTGGPPSETYVTGPAVDGGSFKGPDFK